MLAADDELAPRSLESLTTEVDAIATRHDTPEAIVAAIRAMRRKELFRLATGEILGTTRATDVGRGLTDVATASIDGALRAARWLAAGRLPALYTMRDLLGAPGGLRVREGEA